MFATFTNSFRFRFIRDFLIAALLAYYFCVFFVFVIAVQFVNQSESGRIHSEIIEHEIK